MDAAQEVRAAEIDAALKKRGADEIRGPERTKLVDELNGLLGAGEQADMPLAPEKQARADEIAGRLRDHVAGKPDANLDVFERRRLSEELSQLLTGASGDGAAGENP